MESPLILFGDRPEEMCVVRGVTLLDERGCLPATSMPLESAVLFGLNATGKSTLLRAMSAALAGATEYGAESNDLVHVWCPGDIDASGGLGQNIRSAVASHADRLLRDDLLEPLGVGPPESDATQDLVAYLLRAEGASEELSVAIAGQSRWSLEPDGETCFLNVAIAFDENPLLQGLLREMATLLPPADSSEPHPMSLGGRHYVTWPVPPGARAVASGRVLQGLVAALAAAVREVQHADWAAWPVLAVSADGGFATGSVYSSLLRTCSGLVTETGSDVALESLQPKVRQLLSGEHLLVSGDSVEPEGELAALLSRVGDRATTLLRMCLPRGPELRVELAPPWSGPAVLAAVAVDAPSGQAVRMDALSSAERRWAAIALQLATMRELGRENAFTLVLDEPESGLHPLARREAARGLRAVAAALGGNVILASHAAEFLDFELATLWHISRNGPTALVRPLPRSAVMALAEAAGEHGLGLTPAEVLNLVRVFVIMEGAHDVALVDTWLRPQLAAAQAKAIPMRGTHNLNTVLDAQLLMEFSQARLLVVLDNTRSDVAEAWARVVDADAQSREALLDSERRRLDRARRLSPEETKLFELFGSAVRRGIDRLSVFGLEQPDVIQYLPARAFDSRPGVSWQDLVHDWGKRGDFKDWLRKRGAKVSAKRLAQLAADLPVPNEFRALGLAIETAADRPLLLPQDWSDS